MESKKIVNGPLIRELRIRKNLTADELSKRIDLSRPNFYNYEAGKITKPRPEVMEALSRELGVSLDQLFIKKESNENSRAESISWYQSEITRLNQTIEMLAQSLKAISGNLGKPEGVNIRLHGGGVLSPIRRVAA